MDDHKLELLRAILSIADVLDLPIQPEQKYLYSATQLLSDAIRGEGFEGVTFRSSIGPGINLACFDASAFEFVAGSEQAHEVAGLAYNILPLESLAQGYDANAFEPVSTAPLSNLVHGMRNKTRRV